MFKNHNNGGDVDNNGDGERSTHKCCKKPSKCESLRKKLISCFFCDDKDVVEEALPSELADRVLPGVPVALQAMASLPTVDIVEQPASTAPFRSLGCVGWVTGAHSTAGNKTYPTIRINNYQGNVVIGVYCSNKNDPFSPHPNKLVNNSDSPKRVVTIKASVSTAANECHFPELGIQRGNPCDIQKEVKQRKNELVYMARSAFGACNNAAVNNSTGYNTAGNNAEIVDSPIRQYPLSRIRRIREKHFDLKEIVLADDYEHHTDPQRIDMNTVRLVFQVYLQEHNDALWVPLAPVASDLIYDDNSLPRKIDLLTEYDLLFEYEYEA